MKTLLVFLSGVACGAILLVVGALFCWKSVICHHCGSITGNGEIASRSYSFIDQPFKAIVFSGSGEMDVQVTHQARTANATITADSNLLPYIEAYVEQQTLHIGKRKKMCLGSFTNLKISVQAEELQSVTLCGSGNSTIKNIKTDTFAMRIQGSGDTDLQGEAKSLSVTLNGSGNMNAHELNTQEAEVNIFGSGKALVNAAQKISVDIHGSGSVEYWGHPLIVKQSIHGSGEVIAHEH